jgi:AcrR family transcriptional regulator
VPRKSLHAPEAMLDVARDLLLEEGAHGATIEAISAVSGAPTGSIYHRFGSRDELVTRLWMRAVRRSQAAFLDAVDVEDPALAAVSGGMSIFDFCRAQPRDARLLVSFRYEDLVRAAPQGPLADELRELNRPVEAAVAGLARALHGRATPAAMGHVLLVVFDLPYGAVRRHLIAGVDPPQRLRADLERALRGALAIVE